MTFKIIGDSSGIGAAALTLMLSRGHRRVGAGEADVMLFVAGHDYEVCVELLLECVQMRSAAAYVVVTSEHGAIPVSMDYARYAAMKAAQKMVCLTMAKSGIPCVDVSPAFVLDSGSTSRTWR